MNRFSYENLRQNKHNIEVKVYATGTIEADKVFYSQKMGGKPVEGRTEGPIYAFSLTHPIHGDVMIDAGFSDDFYKNPPFGNLNIVMRIFQRINNIIYKQKEHDDINSRITKEGIMPQKVMLTHMHPDHTSGIVHFKDGIDVYFGKEEDNFYYNMLVGKHIKGKKKVLIDFEKGVDFGPFDKAIDVFGDNSLIAISTKGHTKDHIAYFVNGIKPYFIVGDAELSEEDAMNGVYINSDYGKKGEGDVRESAHRVRSFAKEHPEVVMLYSHE